jgi:hypothetical protein
MLPFSKGEPFKYIEIFANREYNTTMTLKPQDVVILLKLVVWKKGRADIWVWDRDGRKKWTYHSLALELFMSPAEVHAGVKRLVQAGLIQMPDRLPVIKALEEFLLHGVKYVFPPDRGGMTRGLPTSYAGPPLENVLIYGQDPVPVWPYPDGFTRGLEFSPLYRTVPRAAALDHNLYEMLTLVDAIRDGRTRETAIAVKELKSRLRLKYKNQPTKMD